MTGRPRPSTRPAPPRRALRGDEHGVSNVLGAILVFGLLVVTLAVVQTRFVPVWDEDREARHMQLVGNQMASLLSDLDRLAGNESVAAVSDPLTLSGEGGFRFFRGPGGGAANGAAFGPSAPGGGFNVTATGLRILSRNGQDLFGLGESWVAIPTTTTPVEGILRVDHLRVRVDMVPGDYDDGDSATLTVTDASGATAGRAVVTFREFPSEDALETKVYNAAGQEISSDVEAFFQQTAVDYFYINLLDANLLFRTVLGSAQAPFDLGLVRDGLGADYALAAATQDDGQTGSGGLLVPSYALEVPSGTLSMVARNGEYPSQAFAVEHGALIVAQEDGAAMRVPPALRVAATGAQATLSWTLPSLAGDAASLSGGAAASILATPTGARNDVLGIAGAVQLRIPTAYPAVWQAFLEDQMRAAGLSSLAGHYTVAPGAGHVTLSLTGPVSASGTEDVVLSLQQATIRIDVRPTG